MSIRDQIGVFFVARDCIDDTPETVMAIMGGCVVVDIKYSYARDLFEYTALSPHFDRIESGQTAPTYSAAIEKIGEQYKVSFKRIPA